MLNPRRINSRFMLSGGWQHLSFDAQMLEDMEIIAVLDLQFTPEDDPHLASTIKEALKEYDIAYHSISFNDWDDIPTHTLAAILVNGEKFIQEQKDKKGMILIKCGAGVSRSPAMLIYHLCLNNNWSAHEAIEYIRDKEEYQTQFGISLNRGFNTYLRTRFPYAYES